MQAAVILGYISGVFSLIGGGSYVGLLFVAAILMIGGAFGTANNKKAGWVALAVGAGFLVMLRLLIVLLSISGGVNSTLVAINGTVFPAALLAAVLHPHTREYMKAWFE